MGKEIRLSARNFDPEAALQFVQPRFCVISHVAMGENFELFVSPPDSALLNNLATWPPAFVAVEDDGFYFCDNLLSDAEAALIFKGLCEFMLTTNEKVLIAEL